MHILAAVPTSASSVASLILWGERAVRWVAVGIIIGVFLWKGGGSPLKHLLEIFILLILGVWVVPTMVPPKAAALVASWTTGSAAGATGMSWAILAALTILTGIVLFVFR